MFDWLRRIVQRVPDKPTFTILNDDSVSIGFPNPVQTGHEIEVEVLPGEVKSVKDSNENVYTQDPDKKTWRAIACKGGDTTITITFEPKEDKPIFQVTLRECRPKTFAERQYDMNMNWYARECSSLSFVKTDHPGYIGIRQMGEIALPFLVNSIREETGSVWMAIHMVFDLVEHRPPFIPENQRGRYDFIRKLILDWWPDYFRLYVCTHKHPDGTSAWVDGADSQCEICHARD